MDIRWINKSTLKDLDLADDLHIMSYRLECMRWQTYKLIENAAKTVRISGERQQDRGDKHTLLNNKKNNNNH